MLASCGRSCELWADHAPEATAAVARRAQRRDARAACAVDRVEAAGARYVAATSAELNGLARFHDALRNRTCAAYEADGTNPLAPAVGAATTTLDLDRPLRVATLAAPSAAAAIYHVEGFAAAAECRDAVADAAPRMAPATVNEEANKAAKSTSRRAHAANLVPDLGRHDSAPTKLWRRAFALANALTDYDLDGEAGQEPFSVIHYNGSVAGAGPPDEYLPHCDGQCEGSPHQAGGRVATLLLYCRAPARGGATTFANARVAVAPRAGDAVFFSYLDAASGRMDVGHTLHSGCPVVEGDKWVLTLWFRKGVSAAEQQRFDPTGARHDATEVVAWDEGLGVRVCKVAVVPRTPLAGPVATRLITNPLTLRRYGDCYGAATSGRASLPRAGRHARRPSHRRRCARVFHNSVPPSKQHVSPPPPPRRYSKVAHPRFPGAGRGGLPRQHVAHDTPLQGSLKKMGLEKSH